MATELEDNLRLILNEKTNKIIPENIKAGVNILGVTGNYTSMGKLPTITIGEITTDTPNESVTVQITDNNGVELLHNDNIYYISASPFYCTVNQNDTFKFRKELKSLSDKILNIHVLSNPYLCDNYNKSDFSLSGNLTESSYTINGTLTFSNKDGYNGLYTNGSNNIQYSLTNSIPSYEISFDFYKSDSIPYSRGVTIYTDNTAYEIEIKGSSSAIYWAQELSSSWKQNTWNNLKLVKSSSNNDVKLYINGSLVATRSYAGNIKGFKFNSGSDSNSRFNGWYKNIRIKNTESTLNEPELTLTDTSEILNISPSVKEQEIIIPSTAQTVKVSAVTSSIDSNILPENIKKDVSILGVAGIYETVITSEEYNECLTLTNSILGSANLIPVLNGLVLDLEANSNNITNSDGVIWTDNLNGKQVIINNGSVDADNSIAFNGTNTSFDSGITQEELKNGYTVITRIYPTEWGNYKGVFGSQGSTGGLIGLQHEDGLLDYSHMPLRNKITISSDTLSTNTWNTVACSYYGTTGKIYVNGELVASGALDTLSPSGNLIFGYCYNDANRYFKGNISHCIVYNRMLSDSEVKTVSDYIGGVA